MKIEASKREMYTVFNRLDTGDVFVEVLADGAHDSSHARILMKVDSGDLHRNGGTLINYVNAVDLRTGEHTKIPDGAKVFKADAKLSVVY